MPVLARLLHLQDADKNPTSADPHVTSLQNLTLHDWARHGDVATKIHVRNSEIFLSTRNRTPSRLSLTAFS